MDFGFFDFDSLPTVELLLLLLKLVLEVNFGIFTTFLKELIDKIIVIWTFKATHLIEEIKGFVSSHLSLELVMY
jgi:hypothetical protein